MTKIVLQELVVDATALPTKRDGHPITLDDIVEAGERVNFYNRGLRTNQDDTIYALTTEDDEIIITADDLVLDANMTQSDPSYVGPDV
jgi:predicted nuclease of predicted toxin-antitoxin system